VPKADTGTLVVERPPVCRRSVGIPQRRPLGGELSGRRWSLCVPGWFVVLDRSRRQPGPGSGGTWMGLLHMP